ncbi:hypothetical protein D3C74_475770 [compost metagenome]
MVIKTIGASWPWNLSTVPTLTASSPFEASTSRTRLTWALYAATTSMSVGSNARWGLPGPGVHSMPR